MTNQWQEVNKFIKRKKKEQKEENEIYTKNYFGRLKSNWKLLHTHLAKEWGKKLEKWTSIFTFVKATIFSTISLDLLPKEINKW